MKHSFSLIFIGLLIFLLTACTVTDSRVFTHPQANKLVTTSEISMPSGVKRLSGKPTEPISEPAPDIAEDSIAVRVVESPKVDTSLAFIAIVISTIAVLFSAFSLVINVKLQIKHNHDEVRPVVAIHLDTIDMSVKIKNHGVGPAVFKSLIWKNVKTNVSANTIEKLLGEKWHELNLWEFFSIYTKPFVGALDDPDILAPQEELFFINASGANSDEKRALGETFQNVEICLTYTDLYENEEWTLKKNLSWIAK